jgi:hypothetical protein
MNTGYDAILESALDYTFDMKFSSDNSAYSSSGGRSSRLRTISKRPR